MEYLLYFPLDTGWELAFFMGLMAAWFVSDYVCNSKPKRSKRTERQIFDEYREVEEMIFTAVITDRFSRLDMSNKRAILRLIFNNYNLD